MRAQRRPRRYGGHASDAPDQHRQRDQTRMLGIDAVGAEHRFQPREDRVEVTVTEQDQRKQLGRASGRERVCQYVSVSVGAVSVKKSKTTNQPKNTINKTHTKLS